MNIAVSGCGIAGTAVASLLCENKHDVTIFEQAESCQPIGAGIMLQSSGQEVLGRMGLLEGLASVSQKLSGMTAMLASGRTLVNLEFAKFDNQVYALGVHRSRLFETLLQRCKDFGVGIKTDCQVTGFDSSSNTLTTKSQSGTVSQHVGFDFVIAADGSRSTLREASNIPTRVTEYEYAALWHTGKSEFQPSALYQVVDGTDRLLGLLPIGGGESSFFWGLPKQAWESLKNSNLQQWKAEAEQLCPQASSILNTIDDFESLTFGTYRNVAMKRWHADGVVFIGDAAHATSPHLGQGVNLALEDALVFSESLQSTNDFENACRRYNQLRARKLRFYRQLT